jgi:25S rRNA (uracil2634-N3)-methyltransferase
MPKPKKQHGAPPKKSRKMNTFAKLSTTSSGKTKPGGDGAKTSQNGKKTNQGQNQTKQQQKKRKPIVPFARGDRILLIGEGELSSHPPYMHPSYDM